MMRRYLASSKSTVMRCGRIVIVLLVAYAAAISYKASAEAGQSSSEAVTRAATPTPDDRNQGVFYMMMAGSSTLPLPLPPHAKGVFMSVSWSQVEPKKGVFDWTPITNVESQLQDGQYLQVAIVVGAYGSPTSVAACSFRGKTIAGCTPWLGTASGIKIHSTIGVNGANNGYPACTTLVEPNPADPVYIYGWEGLVNGFERQFRGDKKIAMVSIQPMSDVGFNLSLSTVNSREVTVCSPEYYNQDWDKLSGCKGNESCWQTYVENAFRTLWSYEVSHLPDQNLVLWNPSYAFPNVTSIDGGYDFDIRNAVLQFASANHPTGGGTYELANEALQASLSWDNAVRRWAPGADRLGAQMARSNADSCSALKSAGIDYGASNGAGWIEIYRPDFDACPEEIGQISAAMGGTRN